MSFVRKIRQRLMDDPRLKRMLHGGLSGFLARGVSMLAGLFTLPLTVRYLGKLEYGVWITISTTVLMFNMLDLGIANTLTNFISEAYAKSDTAKAKQYYATAFWLTVLIVIGVGFVSAAAWPFISWGKVLSISDPVLIHQSSDCAAISVVFLLICLPLNLANRVLAGYQQMHIVNYFQMANSVVGLFAIVAAIFAHGTIVTLMLAYCAAMLIGSFTLNIWIQLFDKPWIRPHPRHASLAIANSLFREGILFFVIQLTTIVVFNSDNLVISHFLGADRVAPYAITWRLVNYATLFQVLLIPSFWPAFTEAYVKADLEWVHDTYRKMTRTTSVVVSSAAIACALFGKAIIRFWAGSAYVPPTLLLWTMAFWAVVSCMTTNQALLLTATGRLKVEASTAVVSAVANLGLSIYLVQRIGAEGVILSTVLSFLVFMLVPQALEVRRVLKGVFLPKPQKSPPVADLKVASSDSL
jgi:O-antigen/teichoic acid export membrane protein